MPQFEFIKAREKMRRTAEVLEDLGIRYEVIFFPLDVEAGQEEYWQVTADSDDLLTAIAEQMLIVNHNPPRVEVQP